MNIKSEVNLKKLEIKNIKNRITELKNKEKELDRTIKELLKDKENNQDKLEELENDKLNNSTEILKVKELLHKEENNLVIFAIRNNYDITTEDIAVMIDSTTDFVTRKLKQEIEHINIKFEAREHIFDFNKFNVTEICKLDQKSIFFNRDDVKEFMKKHLFNVEEEVLLTLNIENINLDKDKIFEETKKYLKEKSKRYDFHTHIDDETVEKIMNNEIELSKASSIKFIVYERQVLKNIAKMRKTIKEIYVDNKGMIKDEVISEQYKRIDDYIEQESSNTFGKKVSIIHDMQVQRFIKSRGYTKYNFVYSNKAIALYDTTKNYYDRDSLNEEQSSKIEEGICGNTLKIKALKALIHENLKNEIIEHLNRIQSTNSK